jgi:septation ring formation regulator EzrA
MFRVLGILIVVLILIVVVAAAINSSVVRPARNRKRIEQLEAENERLDALLGQQPRKETHE